MPKEVRYLCRGARNSPTLAASPIISSNVLNETSGSITHLPQLQLSDGLPRDPRANYREAGVSTSPVQFEAVTRNTIQPSCSIGYLPND